jgi:hypothetical protein
MPARWNDELTCKYVELYKEHECLWNMNSTLYKIKDARKSALEEIVRKMGLENFTTEDAKQKIKSLTLSLSLGKKKSNVPAGVT